MTTNKQIEEQTINQILNEGRSGDLDHYGCAEYNPEMVKKLTKHIYKLIKQTQKDTLDKVREIMKETWGGCACGYHGYLVLPDCDEEKHEERCFDCKLNQLEKGEL